MEYSEALNDYVEGYQSIFTALENELQEVEHFFDNPILCDVVDHDAFGLHKCLTDTTPADVIGSLPDVCEDFLLDFVNDETNMPEKIEETDSNTSTGEVNPLARIFRFKTRARNVKGRKPATYDYLKSFSMSGNLLFNLSDMRGESESNAIARKRHVSWSVPEVSKLIEGVSQLGVGKWTEIKRLFFSSCHHRSAVDLKDKWRNLLRASCKSPYFKGKGEWVQGNGSPTIPDHILCKVRELSVAHPYPKKQGRSKRRRIA